VDLAPNADRLDGVFLEGLADLRARLEAGGIRTPAMETLLAASTTPFTPLVAMAATNTEQRWQSGEWMCAD
jgi:hypothetical protein